MELEDLRSDLNALKKLYGLLQSKWNILQVAGSENFDDTSRQLLKKLLDGATKQAFQSHSKITTEKSSASFVPDSPQKLPTSNTNPSMDKETPESAQAPEERDESQRDQGPSASERQKKLKRETRKERSFCRICEKSDAKGQILSTKEKKISSDSNEKTEMMNKNRVHRPGHGRFKTQDHLSKTGKELESTEEETQGPAAKIHKNQNIVGLGPDSTISLLVLHNGSENGPFELIKKKEKKSQTTISDEAAMTIRRIDDHLPVKQEPENAIIVPGQMLIQHPFQVKELQIHHQHVEAPKLQTNEFKSWPVETSGSTMKANNLLPSQHKCRRTDKMDPPTDHTPNESSLLMGRKSTNQMNGKAFEDQQSRCTLRLVGPTLERTLTQHKKDANVSECRGPDQKRKQQTTDRKINPHALHKTDTKRKISASSSIKVPNPTNLNRHRVPETHHKKERDSTDRMMSRITGPGPSRLERVLTTRTVDSVQLIQKEKEKQKQKQKQRVRCRQSHNLDLAKQAPKVGPTLEKYSTRIISSSGPVKALNGEMIDGQDSHQQKKRMRHQLAWKETPRRTNRKPIQEKSTSSCTSCSSASGTSDSSSTSSRRVARADSRERKLPNRMLTHRAQAAEMRLPRRTMTHHAGPTPTARKLPLPPPPREKRSLTKPKMHGKALPHKEESSHKMVGPTTSANGTHQVVEKRTEGRLRRFRNKLGIIFHHHHHHHHHHHLGGHQSGVNGQDDDRSESSEVGHHHHRSLWRYLRDMTHHTAKVGHVKLAAEVGGERAAGTVGKSVVRRATGKQQKGHLHALVDRLLRHLWHSKKQQKWLGKSGSRKIHCNNNNNKKKKKKEVKQHWWQRFHGRRGVKLVNHKNARLTLSFRRPKDKKTV